MNAKGQLGASSLSDLVDKEYDPHVRATPQTDDAVIEFEGFFLSPIKQKLYWLFIILSFGFLWLLARWIPKLYVKLNCSPSSLSEANRICAKVSRIYFCYCDFIF